MIRAAASSESNSFQYLFAVWFALTSSLIVGFMTVGVPSAAGDPFRLMDVVAQPAPAAPSVLLTSEPTPAERYPSITYGGLTWSIVESRLIPKADTPYSKPIIVVEAIVANTTSDVDLRVRDSDLAITWPDGRMDEVSRFERPVRSSSFSVEPGTSREVTVVFKPKINDDPDVATLAFKIAEPGRIPASIPLGGRPEPSRYPLAGELEIGTTIVEDPDDPQRRLIVAPLTAALDLNAGPYRAAPGERLALIRVSVRRTAVAPDPFHLEPEFWRLRAGGEIIAPVRILNIGSPAVNEDEIVLQFVVDEAATDMVLTVAANTLQAADHTIGFPRP